MSWARPFLNLGLRLTEKPYLARVTDPDKLRERLERKVRRSFAPPAGVAITEDRLGEIPALRVQPEGVADAAPVVLYFHGGGYVFGSPRTHAHMLARLARGTGLTACLPFYRLAPEHRFPAALDDAQSAYQALMDRGVAPERIVLGGDSAGGGLALALLGRLIAEQAPLPAALFGFSPLTDLTFSGESYRRNAFADSLLPASRDRELVAMYLGAADAAQPGASPLFARFEGAPPVWLRVGSREILLDDTRRMAAALREQGVRVDMAVEQGLPHIWPFFWRYLPEGRATLRELADWLRQQPTLTNES